ncbi:MAG: roadblock/LC7 domain-containing protein [Chloroherpetonaceae bacterium]
MSETLDAVVLAKQDLLKNAHNEAEYKSVLTRLDAKQLKDLQKQYWDFLIEESQTTKKPISRGDILSRLEPTAKYQQRARCKEPEGYCTISMCVRINPKCAVTRISEIMLAIRPLIVSLLNERPELLDRFNPVPMATSVSQTLPEVSSQPTFLEEAPLVRRERVPEVISDAIRQKFQKYKETLGRMVETEGLEHAILMSEGGTILVHASSRPHELETLSAIVGNEIFAVTEQGEAANLNRLLSVIKEYSEGVVAIRSIGEKLYLVGVSRIILPAKIHSLMVKLGTELSREVSKP